MRTRTDKRDWDIHNAQYKSHLWRLPNLDEPTPDYLGASKEALMIFPIMEGGDNRLIEDHIVRSACWARRSWLQFSDAMDLDIAIKFYIDETPGLNYNRGSIIRILQENYVDIDVDVLWCDMSRFPSDKIFSKKHAFYVDRQLSEYKWVYAMDSDMFLASRDREKFNFFERLISHEETMGVTEIHRDTDYCMMASRFFTQSPSEIIENNIEGKSEQMKKWSRSVYSMAGKDVLAMYERDRKSIIVTKMPIIAYPARKFWDVNEVDYREWWAIMGELLGHDEETASIWHAMDNPLWDISKAVGLPVYWWEKDKKIRNMHPIYLCHACDMSGEYLWRKDIDAL